VYQRNHFEEMQVAAPTGCFVEGQGELVPTVVLNTDYRHTKMVLVIFPFETAPGQRTILVESQDYMCHNSNKL
jgi:hypothetical protein